jgi:hypothetical protein
VVNPDIQINISRSARAGEGCGTYVDTLRV